MRESDLTPQFKTLKDQNRKMPTAEGSLEITPSPKLLKIYGKGLIKLSLFSATMSMRRSSRLKGTTAWSVSYLNLNKK